MLRPAAGPAGFTLVEILLAATLGALLLMATATSAGMFGAQLSVLEGGTASELQAALASVADDTRYAWTASVPASRTLVLTGPQGQQTTYTFTGDALQVTRPDGSTGILLDGLSSASFSAETTTRYREAAPVSRSASFWTATPTGTAQATVLEPGDRLALGFMPSSVAPIPGSTPGVSEQMTQASLDTVSLPLQAISPLATGATLTLSLHRARAPLDGRPEGAALASTTVLASALPASTSWVWNTKTEKVVNAPKKALWGWWTANSNYALIVTPPATSTTFDVSGFGTQVKPGYAYTLVLECSGSGVALASCATASATQSGIALCPSSGAWAAQSLAVARSLSGTVGMTRTTATEVVSRVLISLTDVDGNQASSSATVIGQSLAEDAWLGVVPGETDA